MNRFCLPATLVLLIASSAQLSGQITQEEYAERRARLASQVEAPVIVGVGAAGNENFQYLTGLVRSDAILLMVRDGEALSETIFLPDADPNPLLADGSRYPTRGAPEGSGLERRNINELEDALRPLLASSGSLATAGAYNPGQRANAATRILAPLLDSAPDVQLANANRQVSNLRAIKSDAELALIKRAIRITAEAHREIMRTLRPGLTENDIKEVIDAVYRRHGADPQPGFPHIVASAANSVVLHYRGGDRVMENGDHVKIDIGASFQGYVADITRTYPVNGRFSPAQREIYEIVLAAQLAAEHAGVPGASNRALSAAADRALGEGLTRIGLLDAPDATYDCLDRRGEMTTCDQLRLFYFHGLGHGIGLVVHDSRPSSLEVGAAYTIEPGIYVRPDLMERIPDSERNQAYISRMRQAFERYAGIGVRIEDDYVVTPRGVQRVSMSPREIEEIETFMAAYRHDTGAHAAGISGRPVPADTEPTAGGILHMPASNNDSRQPGLREPTCNH